MGGEKIQGFIFKYIVEVALFTYKKDGKLWLDMSLIFQTTVPSAESGDKFLSWCLVTMMIRDNINDQFDFPVIF